MSEVLESPSLFGDQLALARQHWLREMGRRLDELGYHDYRRSDAVVLRLLLRAAVPLGRLGASLGVTRQGARKVVAGLVEREFVLVSRDEHDARRLLVELAPAGSDYADCVVKVVQALNAEIIADVGPEELEAARAVLRVIISSFG
jgi:DNA-binding MarR family transcriptional regulator